MKLLKKVLSSVCALSMVAAMMVTAVSVEAASPKFTAKLTSYDKATGEGTITVSASDLADEGQNAWIAGFQSAVVFDDADFDTSLYTYDENWESQIEKNVVKGSVLKADLSLNGDGYILIPEFDEQSSGIPIGYAATKAADWTSVNDFKNDNTLYTFNFKVKDPTKENTISFEKSQISLKITSVPAPIVSKVTSSPMYEEKAGTLAVEEILFDDGQTIVIPPATGATATGDAIKNLDVTYGDGDDETEAASALANLKVEGAVNAAKFTLSRKNIAADKVEEMEYTEDLANLEVGDLTLGVIVQYIKGEYTDVVITGMELN